MAAARATDDLLHVMERAANRTVRESDLRGLLRRMARDGQLVEQPDGWRLAPEFAADYGPALLSCGFDDDREN